MIVSKIPSISAIPLDQCMLVALYVQSYYFSQNLCDLYFKPPASLQIFSAASFFPKALPTSWIQLYSCHLSWAPTLAGGRAEALSMSSSHVHKLNLPMPSCHTTSKPV